MNSIDHLDHIGAPIERRQTESNSMLLHIRELQVNVKALDEKMTYHHGVFREEVEKSVERVYATAFPDGDPLGHRKHHELVIQREEARVKFWNEMLLGASKWAGMGVLAFLAHAAWVAFLKGPKP